MSTFAKVTDHAHRVLATSGGRALVTLFSLVCVAVFNFGTTLLLARALAPDDFGQFILIAALCSVVGEVALLGGYDTTVKAFAVGEGPKVFISASVILVVCGGLFALAIATFTYVTLHAPGAALFALTFAFTEIVAFRFVILCEGASIALRRPFAAAACRVLFGAVRCGVVALGFLFGSLSLPLVGVLLTVAGVVAAAVSMLIVGRSALSSERANPLRLIHRGSLVSAAAQGLRASSSQIDKLALGVVGSLALVGNYGLASRFIAIGMLPLQSYLRTIYPIHFSPELRSKAAALRHLRLETAKALLYAALGAVMSAVGYWAVRPHLGKSYTVTVPMVAGLAAVLLPQAVINVLGDFLAGQGLQGHRLVFTVIQAGLTGLSLLVFVNAEDLWTVVFALWLAAGASAIVTVAGTWAATLKLADTNPTHLH